MISCSLLIIAQNGLHAESLKEANYFLQMEFYIMQYISGKS